MLEKMSNTNGDPIIAGISNFPLLSQQQQGDKLRSVRALFCSGVKKTAPNWSTVSECIKEADTITFTLYVYLLSVIRTSKLIKSD